MPVHFFQQELNVRIRPSAADQALLIVMRPSGIGSMVRAVTPQFGIDAVSLSMSGHRLDTADLALQDAVQLPPHRILKDSLERYGVD